MLYRICRIIQIAGILLIGIALLSACGGEFRLEFI